MAMTAQQEAVWSRREKGMSQREIAEELNISRRTVRGHLAAVKTDPAIAEAMAAFGLEIQPNQVWFKNPQFSVQAKIKPQGEADFLTRVTEAFENIPQAPDIQRRFPIDTEMMVVYPLFDVHLGMRAHAGVSGEETDLKTGAQRVLEGLSYIMGGSPNSYRAVIINGGDFTHQTDDMNKTRRSGHGLDVDGRNVMTVLEAIEVISAGIEMALTKHEVVDYYSVPGNHDPQNWETILIGLRERYRNHPRVTIYFNFDFANSSEFSVVEHGEVALFIHHGDKRTPKDLAMFCAAEFPDVWGRTRYRLLITGHLHHLKVDEFPGITWMQMPALTVRDQHASGGYRSHSLIMAMGFDRRSEISRNQWRL